MQSKFDVIFDVRFGRRFFTSGVDFGAVLGPFWVWLVIGEDPGTRSIVGGVVVISVLFFHAMGRFRQEQRKPRSPS